MRIAICDDSVKDQEHFIKALHGWDPTMRPECFLDGTSLLAAAQEAAQGFFDIVFLDIYMPGEDGVKIAQELKAISPKTELVFVTTSDEHAVEAFSLHALHYLVKPVTTEGIVEAFHRLTQLTGTKKRPVITLSVGHGSHTVYLDEICYIQSVKHMKEAFLTGGRLIRVWTSMEELEARLGRDFLRLGRGTFVNMEQIEQMGVDTCILRSGIRLDLPRRERTAIRAAYDNFLFTRLSEKKGFDREVHP